MDDRDFYWLIGLLEGEGCFSFRKPNAIRITLGMTDEDVVARAAGLMACKYHRYVSKKYPNNKPIYIANLCGERAFELMKAMRPFLGARRAAKVQWAIAAYRGPLRRACSRNESQIIMLLRSGKTHAEVAAVVGCTPQNISHFAVRLRAKGAPIPDKRHKALPKLKMIADLLKLRLPHREIAKRIGCSRPSVTRCVGILVQAGFTADTPRT